MRQIAHRFVAALLAAALLTAPVVARAQDAAPLPGLPPSAAPQRSNPSGAPASNGEYTAPLSQATQPTYVPQSVALSGPRQINDYEEGDPIPPGYHPETRVRKGLIVGGAVLFGALYFLSALVAAGNADSRAPGASNPAGSLYIPVAGPFVQMASTQSSVANMFLLIDGLGQAGGAAMFIVGITTPKTLLVRNDLATMTLTPMRVGRDGMGFGLNASF